jgi:hypothetical protein
MIRLLSVVGARPNFMKIAPIVEELKNFHEVEHCLVHSGQHYDDLLSGNFFSDLGPAKTGCESRSWFRQPRSADCRNYEAHRTSSA